MWGRDSDEGVCWRVVGGVGEGVRVGYWGRSYRRLLYSFEWSTQPQIQTDAKLLIVISGGLFR